VKTKRLVRFILCVALGLVMVLSTGTRVLAHQGPGKGAVSDIGWRGEYWANSSLSGEPALVRNDRAVDFDWGYDAPVPELPADRFSVRWTRVAVLEEGLYRFRVAVDDGIRLYIDGEPVIDEWRNGSRREMTQDRRLAAGQHTLRIEYYEDGGEAVARVRWEKVTTGSSWKGEYWPNMDLDGEPAMVRNDLDVAFDWQQASPGQGIPEDGFSARWTRTVAFEPGTYRFHVLMDDGVRLWLDERLILDAWSDHDAERVSVAYVLNHPAYTVKVEYYERVGNARIHVWWERVAAPSYQDWKGEYWPNRLLSGDIVLVRNDHEIDFDWKDGAPSPGMPADCFSARWTRRAHFDAGSYQFRVLADDGVRLWVDGQLLIDKWQDQHPRQFVAERTMTGGMHDVKVEYYENTGRARIQVWWEKAASSR
jgi:hypothetical protein